MLSNHRLALLSQIINSLRYTLTFLKCGTIEDFFRLEASSMCQLECPKCPTGKGLNRKGVIGWGYLRFRDFKRLIDRNPGIKSIELSNYGEIFLNPELKDIIEYAHVKNISLTAANGVNLNTINEETIECLVKHKFRYLQISLDGATNNTYGIYRKRGNLDQVIKNVKRINYYKRKYNTKFPKLVWQFVIFGHNEHELPAARDMAKRLGMDFMPRFNWDPSYSPVRNREFVRKESGLGAASKEEFEQKTGEIGRFDLFCWQLWFSPQINWDGKLLGCCVNRDSDFGNVFELGLKKCLRSEKYIYAKKMLLGREKARDDIPCSKCPTYVKIRSSGNPLLLFLGQLVNMMPRAIRYQRNLQD